MPINAEQTKNPREQPNRSCKQTDKSHETSFPANRCIHAPAPLKPCNDKTRNRQNQPDQSCTDHPNVEETHISRKKDLSENWPAGSRRYKRKRADSEVAPYKSTGSN